MDWLIKRLLQYWSGLVMAWTWRLALHLICLCPRRLSLADTDLPWQREPPQPGDFPLYELWEGESKKTCTVSTWAFISHTSFNWVRRYIQGFLVCFFPFLAPETCTLKNSEFYIWNNWFQAFPHDIWSLKIEPADTFDCSSFLLSQVT